MLRVSLLIAGLLLARAAGATDVVIDAAAPYWEVGSRDPSLSRACSDGRFNERQAGLYTIQLHAKKGGAAVLGIAKGTGVNLRDPGHLAKTNEDYYFRDDWTSSCEVFVGGRTNPTPPVDGPK
jgi:hypothetical protein